MRCIPITHDDLDLCAHVPFSQAAEGRADTLELAQRVNEYQSKLRAVTRKIMATVSELSMYQVRTGPAGPDVRASHRVDRPLCTSRYRFATWHARPDAQQECALAHIPARSSYTRHEACCPHSLAPYMVSLWFKRAPIARAAPCRPAS